MSLAPEIQASHDKVAAERTEIYMREKNRILDELDKMEKGSHLDPKRYKHDRVLDNIVGEVVNEGVEVYDDGFKKRIQNTGAYIGRKRGRPKGSKNRVKVSPEEIGTIPESDIVVLRRD